MAKHNHRKPYSDALVSKSIRRTGELKRTLEEQQEELILYYRSHGYSYSEIEKMMHLPVSRIKFLEKKATAKRKDVYGYNSCL